jgi:hypothetical protein
MFRFSKGLVAGLCLAAAGNVAASQATAYELQCSSAYDWLEVRYLEFAHGQRPYEAWGYHDWPDCSEATDLCTAYALECDAVEDSEDPAFRFLCVGSDAGYTFVHRIYQARGDAAPVIGEWTSEAFLLDHEDGQEYLMDVLRCDNPSRLPNQRR